MGFFSRRRPLTAFEWKDAPPPSLCVASAAFVHCNSKHHCMTKSSHSLVAHSSLFRLSHKRGHCSTLTNFYTPIRPCPCCCCCCSALTYTKAM